jgi:hypothetical protein
LAKNLQGGGCVSSGEGADMVDDDLVLVLVEWYSDFRKIHERR